MCPPCQRGIKGDRRFRYLIPPALSARFLSPPQGSTAVRALHCTNLCAMAQFAASTHATGVVYRICGSPFYKGGFNFFCPVEHTPSCHVERSRNISDSSTALHRAVRSCRLRRGRNEKKLSLSNHKKTEEPSPSVYSLILFYTPFIWGLYLISSPLPKGDKGRLTFPLFNPPCSLRSLPPFTRGAYGF